MMRRPASAEAAPCSAGEPADAPPASFVSALRDAIGDTADLSPAGPTVAWPDWTDTPFIALVGYPGLVEAPSSHPEALPMIPWPFDRIDRIEILQDRAVLVVSGRVIFEPVRRR